jgi:tetratricopeptide (TPR) repeat protein
MKTGNHGAIVLFVLSVLASRLFAASAAPDWDLALRKYREGDYAEARAAFERLRPLSAPDPHLFYNLGNTAFQEGSNGRAVLWYERALVVGGDRTPAARNLEFVRKKAGVGSWEPGSWNERIGSALGHPWSLIVALGFALVGSSAIGSAQWVRDGRRRVLVRSVGGALLALGIAHLWCVESAYKALARRGVVTASEGELREEPAESSRIREKLPGGTAVIVAGSVGGWYKTIGVGGRWGWLRREAVEPVIPNDR